jgi:hypothetical protein
VSQVLLPYYKTLIARLVALHDTIARNHRCRTLEELVSQACDWFATCNNHYLEMQNTFAKGA